MQVNQRIAVTYHALVETVGNTRSQAALGIAGKSPVQVATIGQVPVVAAQTRHVDGRHRDERAGEIVGRESRIDAMRNLHAIEFVTVYTGRETQGRTGTAAARNDHQRAQHLPPFSVLPIPY